MSYSIYQYLPCSSLTWHHFRWTHTSIPSDLDQNTCTFWRSSWCLMWNLRHHYVCAFNHRIVVFLLKFRYTTWQFSYGHTFAFSKSITSCNLSFRWHSYHRLVLQLFVPSPEYSWLRALHDRVLFSRRLDIKEYWDPASNCRF